MSATNSLHYQLCCEGAKWLRNKKNRERWRGHWKYIWVEPGLVGENPDIWAFNGDDTICIEVKTSHADFVADQKSGGAELKMTQKWECFVIISLQRVLLNLKNFRKGGICWNGTVLLFGVNSILRKLPVQCRSFHRHRATFILSVRC